MPVTVKDAKVSFGVITKWISNLSPYADFINNARKHAHSIHKLIIGYTHGYDETILAQLRQLVDVDVVCVGNDERLVNRLLGTGVSLADVNVLLDSPFTRRFGLATYGCYRNTVLLQAILNGTDYLLFFDTDTYPKIVIRRKFGEGSFDTEWRGIDFVGRHLEYLHLEDVLVTTSDYSGYYIIPPLKFDGLRGLLIGLQKEKAFEFLMDSDSHRCLKVGRIGRPRIRETRKLLGGNLGLDLRDLGKLAPFFSSAYLHRGECILSRGEDTLLGPSVYKFGGQCLDIDLWIFHNTFRTFPEVPDLRDSRVRDRFYYSCLGWIGRNPFLNWFLIEQGFRDGDLESILFRQEEDLGRAAPKLAAHLNDQRFLSLPQGFAAARRDLRRVIGEYRRTMASWENLVDILGRQRDVEPRHAPAREAVQKAA
ncbi:MAG: hypothetical protein SVX38_00080 [Chloroflexota bacterium]|nr:hypothetical protein [Chloroflexota bacterium]